jgi:hypothetical protein
MPATRLKAAIQFFCESTGSPLEPAPAQARGQGRADTVFYSSLYPYSGTFPLAP